MIVLELHMIAAGGSAAACMLGSISIMPTLLKTPAKRPQFCSPYIHTVLMSNQCASQHVCSKTGRKVVTAILDDGRRFEGDILIGADGIWSKVGCPRVPVAAHRITCC